MKIKFLLLQTIKNNPFLFIWTLLIGSISSFGTIFSSFLIGKIINKIIQQISLNNIIINLIILLISIIITTLTNWITQKLNYQISYLTIEKLRFQSIYKINHLSLNNSTNLSTGDLISRLTNDAENIAQALIQLNNTIFLNIPTIIIAALIMIKMSLPLSMIVFINTPLIIIIMKFITNKNHNNTKQQQSLVSDISTFIDEYLPGQQIINNFNQQKNIEQKFNKYNQKLYVAGQKTQFISSLTNPISRFIDHLTYAFIGLLGGILFYFYHQNYMIGTITSFTLYASQFAKPFIELSGLATQIQTAYIGLLRIQELLNLSDLPSSAHDKIKFDYSTPMIQFENIQLNIDHKTIFNNFNLTINENEKIAIIGETGGGKSTIINLLLKYHLPNNGQIKLFNQNINTIPDSQYYQFFSLVTQDVWLYEDTLYNNLCFGQKIPANIFQQMCQKLKINEIFDKLPNKEQTLLSEANLSYGEKQLLSIGRAYLKNSPILILDEATSSFDQFTEQKITNALNELMENKTCIIIAHHLNTIKSVNRIIVLDKGKITETGTFDELLNQKNSLVAKIYH